MSDVLKRLRELHSAARNGDPEALSQITCVVLALPEILAVLEAVDDVVEADKASVKNLFAAGLKLSSEATAITNALESARDAVLAKLEEVLP